MSENFNLSYSFQEWHLVVAGVVLYFLIGLIAARFYHKTSSSQYDFDEAFLIFVGWGLAIPIFIGLAMKFGLEWLITYRNPRIKPTKKEPPETANESAAQGDNDPAIWRGTLKDWIDIGYTRLKTIPDLIVEITDRVPALSKGYNPEFYFWQACDLSVPKGVSDIFYHILEKEDVKSNSGWLYRQFRTVEESMNALHDGCLRWAKDKLRS